MWNGPWTNGHVSRRPRLAWAVLAVSGAGLVVLTELHARGTIVS